MTFAALQKKSPGAFVFLDERPWPFLVAKQLDGWWLYYWRQGAKEFATMRPLVKSEVERFKPLALPRKQAALYFPDL